MGNIRQQIEQLRRDYTAQPLKETDIHPDPFRQFGQWMEEALKADVHDPNAMVLSTVGPEGAPAARVVLLRAFGDKEGLVFYTNYTSEKARHIAQNAAVALNFHWPELDRQIRVRGTAHQVPESISNRYFDSRPRESQIGAWASEQSQVLDERETLERAVESIRERFADGPVPRPDFWGGYAIWPNRFEFWQGRPSRLHDRLVYTKPDTDWTIQRLSP
ncbi:MAG: pyridoxamine 5'-phosphate oxidase [Bacteroidota bacterium]